MDRAWGIVVDAPGPYGGLNFPPEGVEVVVDAATDEPIAATWEKSDRRTRPSDGSPHRWRYWVPRERIGLLIYDLGPVREDDADA